MESQSSSGNEGVRNFLKLQNLFGASTSQIYRRHFVTVWNHYFRASSGEWKNTKDFVEKKFISGGIGKEIYDSCDEHQKRILRSGNISLWDLSLLLDVIKKLQNAVKNSTSDSDGGIKFLSEEKLEETKNLWAEVDYQSRVIVDYENYGNWMAEVLAVLQENGMSKEEIRTTAFFLEKPAEGSLELDDVGKLADKLKEDGNLAVGKKQFDKALNFYTKAIDMDGLPEGLLGTLYSNRSVCNIHVELLDDAKFDAKCTITLRPSWFKGYLRLGRFYEEVCHFGPASQFYMFAEVLEPGNKEVAESIKACKRKIETRTSKSSVFLNSQNVEKQMYLDNPHHIEVDKALLRKGDPFILCCEGGHYETGSYGYPQDYKRAAELYSKSAEKGYPDGIFALARLTEEGRGVPKDVLGAFEMYKRVAAMPHFMEDRNGLGGIMPTGAVHLAQAKLGDVYREGEIVPQDLEVASGWYKKAMENGCQMSPFFLGWLYLTKEKWNLALAVLHLQLASYRGNVSAIEELANMYLKKNPSLAQKWWKLAIHCGSSEMKKQQHRFKKEELTQNFNPINFRAEIKKILETSKEFKDLMKEFEKFKYLYARKSYDAAFYKVDGIPEEAERELCKAMKKI